MNQLYKAIGLVIFGLILGFALTRSCSKPKVIEHATVTVKYSTIKGKDSTITINHFIPKWKHDTTFSKGDTVIIYKTAIETAKLFNAKNYYDSTLINDKLGLFRVKFNTQYNQVWNFTAQIRRDTLYKIKEIEKVSSVKIRNKLVIGANIASDLNKIDIYGSVWLVTRSGSLFQLGYNPFDKSGMVGAGVTIKLRK